MEVTEEDVANPLKLLVKKRSENHFSSLLFFVQLGTFLFGTFFYEIIFLKKANVVNFMKLQMQMEEF